MNRAFAIILMPVFLAVIGYVVVLRAIGLTPTYWRLILPLAAMGGALIWFARRFARKPDSSAQ